MTDKDVKGTDVPEDADDQDEGNMQKLERTAASASDAMVELLLQQSIDAAARMEAGEPIKLDIDLVGHEGEWVRFQGIGWRFKDMREYEEAVGAANLTVVVVGKIVDWKITVKDEQTEEVISIPFLPKGVREKLEAVPEDYRGRRELAMELTAAERNAFDKLTPDLAAFLWGSFRVAYNLAGTLSPN
jgi:hypothetical protein